MSKIFCGIWIKFIKIINKIFSKIWRKFEGSYRSNFKENLMESCKNFEEGLNFEKSAEKITTHDISA